jgi:hypothetical protein
MNGHPGERPTGPITSGWQDQADRQTADGRLAPRRGLGNCEAKRCCNRPSSPHDSDMILQPPKVIVRLHSQVAGQACAETPSLSMTPAAGSRSMQRILHGPVRRIEFHRRHVVLPSGDSNG